ncbi:hypothetical protein [Paenibacillus sp. TSA_86.1]
MRDSKKYNKEAYIDKVNGREWLTADRLCYNQLNHWTWNGLRERAPTESG